MLIFWTCISFNNKSNFKKKFKSLQPSRKKKTGHVKDQVSDFSIIIVKPKRKLEKKLQNSEGK